MHDSPANTSTVKTVKGILFGTVGASLYAGIRNRRLPQEPYVLFATTAVSLFFFHNKDDFFREMWLQGNLHRAAHGLPIKIRSQHLVNPKDKAIIDEIYKYFPEQAKKYPPLPTLKPL